MMDDINQITSAVAGTIMRDGRALETIMDATDCERIARSVFENCSAVTEAHQEKPDSKLMLVLRKRITSFDAMVEALKTISNAPLYHDNPTDEHLTRLVARHNHAVRLASNTLSAIANTAKGEV
jgi:hypothetical protein